VAETVTAIDQGYPNRGLHGRVVHEIGLRIVSGQLEPGNALPNESELGAELQVSRSVLRESMKVLAGKGLVEVRTKTGTRVRLRKLLQHVPVVIGVALRAGRRVHTREPGRSERSLTIHEEVLEGVVARDGAAARESMRLLVEGASEDMEHYLTEGGGST
jgi:DNA-binding FadR family transcriptional regulator